MLMYEEKRKRTASVLCNHKVFLSFNDMKKKSKKRSLGSKHGPGPATSASDASAGARVTTGVSVSVQLDAPIASLKY